MNIVKYSHLYLQMSGSRMRIAGRFKPCVHMGCFDLETFVELNQRSRKVKFIKAIMSISHLISNIIRDLLFPSFFSGSAPFVLRTTL